MGTVERIKEPFFRPASRQVRADSTCRGSVERPQHSSGMPLAASRTTRTAFPKTQLETSTERTLVITPARVKEAITPLVTIIAEAKVGPNAGATHLGVW